jgi:hypothetical protein
VNQLHERIDLSRGCARFSVKQDPAPANKLLGADARDRLSNRSDRHVRRAAVPAAVCKTQYLQNE